MKKFMRGLLFFCTAMALHAQTSYKVADGGGYQVPQGTEVTIDEHSFCLRVTYSNQAGPTMPPSIFVPTQLANEWVPNSPSTWTPTTPPAAGDLSFPAHHTNLPYVSVRFCCVYPHNDLRNSCTQENEMVQCDYNDPEDPDDDEVWICNTGVDGCWEVWPYPCESPGCVNNIWCSCPGCP